MGGAGENGNGGGGIQPSGVAKVLYSVARISVWWDIENYQVLELDLIMFLQNISFALVNMNYCGPFSISAYGDMTKISASVQQALNSTGIGLDHVPAVTHLGLLPFDLFWTIMVPSSVVVTMENPKSISLIEVNDLNSPAFRDKSKAANPKRLTKVLLLKAQRRLGCISWMAK
ncbi:hypothetical protein T459_11944 [Capsicum annuum]|uniref:Uncharacterized protein n=1 Tax=Capsicum annuum TaxID=4072 RepID=A0A2G2ZNH7_CAPAN|nr:hypothetical protein T459_11944 [Capsicum annuum]